SRSCCARTHAAFSSARSPRWWWITSAEGSCPKGCIRGSSGRGAGGGGWRGLCRVSLERGCVGATVPEGAGGHGLDLTSYLVLVEELAYCWGSLRSSVTTHNMVAGIVADAANDAQRARFLPPLLDGRRIAFF